MKALLGEFEPFYRGCRRIVAVGILTWSSHREVYKGQSRKGGDIVALKKILVHNEKDGVSSLLYRARSSIC